MAWRDCQEYMTTIHNLRQELARELDTVQQNLEPRTETQLAMWEFIAARTKYWKSIDSTDRIG